MADLVMVVTMVAFVLLCVAYVTWCDRIIMRDDSALDERALPENGAASEQLSASTSESVTA
jgi:hypothetical protein